MILIADSGSSKCSWAVCNKLGNIIFEYKTKGFNPNFINSNNIIEHLKESPLNTYKQKIEKIFFYGAGCSSNDNNNTIYTALRFLFINANITIKHDLDAACYAVYNNRPNITCILGTGSNSCYFDGRKAIQKSPSLGFLIGDEASGNYFGKKLLKLYFNNSLSNHLKTKFKSEYETSWPIISKNIYGSKRANSYLAKYFPFIVDNKNDSIIHNMIHKALNEFFELHILCYHNYQNTEINFVGSVAHYLSNEINTVSNKHNLTIGKIIQYPIHKLINFHCNNKNNPI